MTSENSQAVVAVIAERPDRALLLYYLLGSLVTGPFFPIVATVMYFRYHTMRYRVSEDGISMSWGILFRREIIIQFTRIQDIHLRSNVVERWFGLGRILIQTASGSAGAEMTLEGHKNFEAIRDFLYQEMRGVRDEPELAREPRPAHSLADETNLAGALREVAAELREIRRTLQARGHQQ
ncbi:MAG: PH domain-containing protein [Puniceicoccaceae bacterium]|nr:MAG: PH domain-containing protein [Puniceicoccaceae bacterium]